MEHQFGLTFLLLAVSVVQPAIAESCNFPPELWCSSVEISRACHVEKQCAEWNQPVNDAPKVNFSLYYESYCPGCQEFINGQLHDTWAAISEIMNLTLVPYGNAEEKRSGTGWKFQCQHGKVECQGNVLETCILHFAPFPTAFSTIFCMEHTHNPVPNAEHCMKVNGVDPDQVLACANGTLGNNLQHEMAEKTKALRPPHYYVPWVTLNGVHTEKIQNAALIDLKKLICDTYKGTPPPGCAHEVPQLKSCTRE